MMKKKVFVTLLLVFIQLFYCACSVDTPETTIDSYPRIQEFEYPILENDDEIFTNSIEIEQIYAGNTVEFGAYKGQALTWDVVYIENNRALLFLSDILRDEIGNADLMPFNYEIGTTTWEECTLRAWLNGEFYTNVFGEDNSAILMVTNENDNHEQHNVFENLDTNIVEYSDRYSYGGNDTEDYIFLISERDINTYFVNQDILSGISEGYFVRDMYSDNYCAGTINILGYTGFIVPVSNGSGFCGVRPAMWIDITVSD